MTITGNYGALGWILLRTSLPNDIDVIEHRLVCDILNILAVHLENIQLRQRVQATNREMELVDEVAKIVTSLNNLDDLFERLSDCLEEAFDFDQALLSWISSSESNHRIDTLQTFKNSDSAQPLIGGTNNPAPCFRIVTPLSDRGQVIGSLELLKKTPPFSVEELDLLRQVGNHIAPAVYNTGLHHLTIRQAYQLQQRTTGVASPQQSWAGYVTQDEEPMIDLAHALYSPLTSIKGYTGSLLQPDTNWPEEVRQEFLRTINQAADRLNQAIKDLVLPTLQNISSQVAGQPETPLQDISHQL